MNDNAYSFGYKAYHTHPKESCPYDECSIEEADWWLGYYDAEHDRHGDGEE